MTENKSEQYRMMVAGYISGANAGAWVIDGNTSDDTCRSIYRGIEDGDPQVMDAIPSAPFSGEWADGMTEDGGFEDAGIDPEDVPEDSRDDLLRAYEDAYSTGAHDEVWFVAGYRIGKVGDHIRNDARRIKMAAESYADHYSTN